MAITRVTKKVLAVSAIAIAGLALTACSTNTTTAAAAGQGTVKVSGTGTSTVVPDAARVAFSIVVTASSSTQASTKAAAVEAAVLATLVKQGIPEADITTDTVAVGPVYDSTGRTQRITGYQARQSFTVLVRDVAKAGGLVSAVVATGGDDVQIDGTTLIVTDPTAAEAKARDRATTSARAKAEQYASSLDLTLGPVVSVTELSQSQPVLAGASAADAAVSPETKVLPGTQDVSVVVEISWEVSG
ncbi:MAG: SIMPL domain-containing protein [Candidatus Nanopelagicales bacterium]|nr:SIMPL domain-containing protein [Candidatus Nanopelagicales bacterium]